MGAEPLDHVAGPEARRAPLVLVAIELSRDRFAPVDFDAGIDPASGRTVSMTIIRDPFLRAGTMFERILTESSKFQSWRIMRSRYTSAPMTGCGSKKL